MSSLFKSSSTKALFDAPELLDLQLLIINHKIALTIVLLLLTYLARTIFFHPLSKFPGPLIAAVSPVWIARCWNSGYYVFSMKELHDKYGPVVRIAPNHLSFCSANSWRDIYGHVSGRKTFLKSKFFYEPMPGEADNVLTVTDPGIHSRMRRNLSHGFSATALGSQEALVQRFIDQFLNSIKNNQQQAIDMVKWLNLTTFDIIGELAFGESFGNLDSGKPHFWLKTLFGSIEALSFLRSFEYFPPFRALTRWIIGMDLLPAAMTTELKKIKRYSHDQVKKRLGTSPEHTDFLTKMLDNMDEAGTSFESIQAQAEVLVLAGSETTATALSGIIYQLGRHPAVYERLAEEIRTSLQTYEGITGRTTDSLPYLKAVIEEGLRIYPPVPIGLPRVSPGETVDGQYIPRDTIVHVSSWSATHSVRNFHKPLDFIPERWMDPDCKDNKSASQPFSLGSRACLGRHMAWLEMKLILCKLFWKYDFTLQDQTDWMARNQTYVFWKKPELWVNFAERETVQ